MSLHRAGRVLAPFLLGLALTPLAASDASAAPRRFDNEPQPTPPPAPPKPVYTKPTEGFLWNAKSRVDGWIKAWRPQTWPEKSFPQAQAYDPEYVNPSYWMIDVQGCITQEDWDLNMANKPAKNTYVWTANGKTTTLNRCITALQFPTQGLYPVSLEVRNSAGATVLSKSRTVQVRDLLIVAMGDSMSSGEGSPDEREFEGTPYRAAQWVDRQCHRSKSSPAYLAAKRIEQMDPTTSVTFISFACSGATIEKEWGIDTAMFDSYEQNSEGANNGGSGMLGWYVGIESPQGDHVMDIETYRKQKNGLGVLPQVQQLRNALAGKRKADAIVMSAGLNDAGFSKMLFTCTLYSDCPKELVGFQPNAIPLAKRFEQDVNRIPAAYKRLGSEMGGNAKRVLVFEYPNPFTNDKGQTCDEILEDVISVLPGPTALAMTKYESDWAQTFAEPRLHQAIRTGAQQAGFDFVPGVWASFKGHGYCASDQNRWLRRAAESAQVQGPGSIHKNTKGTIHPNGYGYQELSKHIVKALTDPNMNHRPVAAADAYTMPGNQIFKMTDAGKGVLANDTDIDVMRTLKVVNHTQPDAGKNGSKVLVNADGTFTYNPGTGFVGTESFIYTVSDGSLEAIAKVTFTVTKPAAAPSGPTTLGTATPVIKKL